jgi:hypothetical protein
MVNQIAQGRRFSSHERYADSEVIRRQGLPVYVSVLPGWNETGVFFGELAPCTGRILSSSWQQ